VTELQSLRGEISVSPAVRQYIADIVAATRSHPKVRFGVSPRGALGIMRAAQAIAGLRSRDFVLPDDIKELAQPVLEHRLILSHEERTRGATARAVLQEVMETVPVPVPV
jgi:MoxR-like ATPase